jgi:hypothetical protein
MDLNGTEPGLISLRLIPIVSAEIRSAYAMVVITFGTFLLRKLTISFPLLSFLVRKQAELRHIKRVIVDRFASHVTQVRQQGTTFLGCGHLRSNPRG